MRKSRFTQKIDSFVQDPKKIQHKENVYAAELKLSMFLHEHNLPFLLMDHLPKLIYSVCPDSSIAKDIECGRTKVTFITNECLATETLSTLLNNLRASGGFYSLIVDETTDTSTKKSLAVVIRFYHQKLQKVKDCFLGLLEVERADSESLFNCICELLNKHEIPINNMLGFAGDNASVIMGVKSGIQARLTDVNKDVMALGCICHSLHLCSSAAALKLPKSIEEFVRNIYNHFSNAPKRIKEFEEFQNFVNMKPHKMLRPCQTRWLSLQAVVDRVLLLWNPLTLYFTTFVFEDKEKLHSASVILENLKNPVFKIYLLFLSYILEIINKMNLQLKSETTQIHILHSRFTSIYKTILTNFIRKEVLDEKELSRISPSNPDYFLHLESIYMGAKTRLFLQENHVRIEEMNKIRTNILSFYVELSFQIRQRFKFDDAQLTFLSNFEPKVALSGNMISILEAAIFFKKLVSDPENLNTEWRLLPDIQAIKDCENDSFEKFWTKIFQTKNELDEELFPNLNKLVKGIMYLPHSSASAERIFLPGI